MMFEFSPGEVAYLNTPVGEALFNGLLRNERRKTTSFDKASIASFESILIKVPEDIVSLFNELIFADPALRWPILDSLKRSKKKSIQHLKILDKFCSRQVVSSSLQNNKIQETMNNLNKFFLLEKNSTIYIIKANSEADLGNMMYVPLFANADLCPLFSSIAPPNHKRQSLICSNWFDGPMFFNIYHFFSGAYPIVNNTVAERFLNHVKISQMQISDMGALLGTASEEDIKKFNSETCKNFLACLQSSKDNALMIYPQGHTHYSYLDLDFKSKNENTKSHEIESPKGFARWIVEGIVRDLELVVKPLVIYVDDSKSKEPNKDDSIFDEFFVSSSNDKATIYIYENHISSKALRAVISQYIDLEQKDLLKNKIEISQELAKAIDELLQASYKNAIDEISQIVVEKRECKNILHEAQQVLASKLKHNPKLSVTNFIKEICQEKSIKAIKKMPCYELLKGLGIDLDLLFKYYSF